MTKQGDGEPTQYCLDFGDDNYMNRNKGDPNFTAKIYNFIDAGTMAVRRDALRRLREAGIFELPSEASRPKLPE